jgi:DNA-binding response OmpR family regulator
MARILVAEDDPLTLEGLAELLEAEGHEVEKALDGQAALEAFARVRPDLVCLDIMMPRKSGYEVLKRLREADAALPVILISAKSEELDKVLGLELGADDFIVKPFGARELAARVKAALRRAQVERVDDADEGPFAIGDLEVRPAELKAYRGERAIELSAREVRILEVLARRRGKVVDRARFFKEAWDLAEPPLSRTLDQHIARLRKKIEIDPASPAIILTVQGVGYKTEA